MTTTTSSSTETLNTKQLSRIGSGSSGCCTCTTTRTVTTGQSCCSCSTCTPTPTSSGRSSEKSVRLLVPNGHSPNGAVYLTTTGSEEEVVAKERIMTERWFLCSSTARTESRMLAIIDLIASVCYLIVFGMLWYAIFEHPELVERYLEEVPDNQDIQRLLTYGSGKKALFLTVLILRPATSLFIAIMLFTGAQKRNYSMVKFCFIISVIYIVIDMILFIPKTIYTQNGKIYVITYLVNVVYMTYELWVVYQLKKEVQEWHDNKDSEGEPETEDTTVADE